MIEQHFIGPFYIEENIKAAHYLDFLQFDLVHTLAVMFQNDDEADGPYHGIWFQIDGATPHFDVDDRQYFDITFLGRRIREASEWQARSPDFSGGLFKILSLIAQII